MQARSLLVSWFAFMLAGGPVGAQVLGSSEVHIYVSLSDSATRYSPVVGHRMIIFRSPRDSAIVMTDASGSTTAHLAPGVYRLVSAEPLAWHGTNYSWNVPLTVEGLTALVDLSRDNATVNGKAPTAAIVTAMRPAVETPLGSSSNSSGLSGTTTGERSAKDPTIAAIFSFLVTGLGQVYVEQPGKGIALFAVSLGGFVLAASPGGTRTVCSTTTQTNPFGGPSQFSSCRAEPTNTKLVAGLAIAGASWMYSMVDASLSARAYNRNHRLSVNITPTERGSNVGLQVRF